MHFLTRSALTLSGWLSPNSFLSNVWRMSALVDELLGIAKKPCTLMQVNHLHEQSMRVPQHVSACFACVTSLHTHIFTSRHSQFISLSLWQHHGGCCCLPLGELRVRWWSEGGSLAGTCVAGSCTIPRRQFSFRDTRGRGKGRWWREECHAERGGMEILLSINWQDKSSAVNHNGPNLSHWSVVSITCWRERTVGEKQEQNK